jgi:redox-sensing transcriptional repressor
MANLPEKTIERLSIYRKALKDASAEGRKYLYSHDLAKIIHITPEQIRKDLMLISHSSIGKKGYDVEKLSKSISKIMDPKEVQKIALVGLGNLGRAILSYFNGKRSSMVISAVFDIDPEKVDRLYAGVPCYSVERLREIIKNENISLAIITVTSDQTVKIADELVLSGIKGILNFTPTPINVEPYAYLVEYDMISSIEKLAYFSEKYKSNKHK